MRPILTSSQKAANALRRVEKTLRNWQDDPDSPRADVDKMLTIIADLRSWVQGHVIADIENATSGALLQRLPPLFPQEETLDIAEHIRREQEP